MPKSFLVVWVVAFRRSAPSSLMKRFAHFQRDLYNQVYGISTFLKNSAPTYIAVKDLMREQMLDGSVDFYFPNGPHLNPKGHRFIAGALFKVIQDLS